MATVTWEVTTADTGVTPNVSGSFTPAAGDLLVVGIQAAASISGASEVPTASANGITFVQALHTTYNAGAHSLDIYVANQLVPASPAAMTVSWAPADGATGTVIDVVAVAGVTKVGTAAIKQTASGFGAAVTTPSCAFGVACQTGNPTILALANGSTTTPSGPVGWSTVNSVVTYSTPTTGYQGARRASGFTGTSPTWQATSATAWGAVGVEIDASAAVTNYDGTATVAETFAITATGSVASVGRVAPTLIASPATAWNSSTTPKATAAMNVLTGDVLVDVSMSADVFDTGTDAVNVTNSGTNQTWTKNQTVTAPSISNCFAQVATAVQSNNDSAETVSGAYVTGGSSNWGHQALQFRGSDGVGASNKKVAAAGNTGNLSLTTTADKSAVVVAIADWGANSGATRVWATVNGYTPTAGNGGEKAYLLDTGQYTIYVAVYPDVGTAGAKTVGITTPSSITPSVVAVEIKGTGSSGAVTGDATRPETFAVTATGRADHGSGATRAETFTATTTGAVGKQTGAARPLTFAITAAGVVSRAAGATRAETFAITATGSVTSGLGKGATRPETFAITATGRADHAIGAVRAETFTITPVGRVGKQTGTTRAETFTVTAAGVVAHSTGATRALTFAITATGAVVSGKSSGATRALAITITATGRAAHSVGAVRAETFTIAATGRVARASGATRPETFAITATGRAAHSIGATRPLSFGITATGSVTAVGAGAALRPLTFGIIATGRVARGSGAVRALAVAITSTGKIGKQGGANRPLSFGITASNRLGRTAGATRAETFAVLATGTKAARSGANRPLTFAVTATGHVSLSFFGGAALALSFGITAAGAVTLIPPGSAVQGPQAHVLLYAGNAQILNNGGGAKILSGQGSAQILEA